MTETWRSPELHPKPNNTNIIKGSAVKFSLLCRHAAEANINRLCFIHFRVSFMNNQKQQKPTLTGQRFKTRKRGLCESFSALHAFCCSYQTRVLIHDVCFFFFTPPTDEKERFDPTQFQESIVQGLNQTGTDLEAVAKFLDASGAKLDYRRYAETLFDILVAGGMLGELCWSIH